MPGEVTHLEAAATEGWFDYPMNVVEGDPQARGVFLRQTGSDGFTHMSGFFEAQPSVCKSTIGFDESLVVTKGSARIEFEDGSELELSTGDMVFLPAGTNLTWHYLEPFRETFFATSYKQDSAGESIASVQKA